MEVRRCSAGLKVLASAACSPGFDCVSGQRAATGVEGIVTFDSIRVDALNGTYNLKLSPDGLDQVIENPFSIRYCLPGEVLVTSKVRVNTSGEELASSFICNSCGFGHFSFLPAVQCLDCDDNALCPGGAGLVPRDGYWHSTPFSTQFHECLVEGACSYSRVVNQVVRTRVELLTEFYTGLSLEEVVAREFSNDEYPQCRKVRGQFNALQSEIVRGLGYFYDISSQ